MSEPGPGLFREILLAPDRDRESGAWPLVSSDYADDEDFRGELERRGVRRIPLRRRGRDHGEWTLLRPEGLIERPPKGKGLSLIHI